MASARGSRYKLKQASLTTRHGKFASKGYPTDELCYLVSMTTILRIFAWLLAAAVTFATLGPPQFRPHSDLGQDGEHAFAFVLVGLAFGFAYTRYRLLTTVISVVTIGIIEILQLWAPGRHARFEDFVVDALAACAGLAVAAGMDWVIQRSRRSSAGAT
ncbi:VanZ like family protein [Bradyrhizobium erythrophlei]|uniref:VanZ like family protein n=2 Tax=Bradyrhizobium erythrophlei TaxID=1437360 RepID=A0A1M5MZX7_9BRAD|nr:VanZ like family protein [Bradyrhizobium erythrophlei]